MVKWQNVSSGVLIWQQYAEALWLEFCRESMEKQRSSKLPGVRWTLTLC